MWNPVWNFGVGILDWTIGAFMWILSALNSNVKVYYLIILVILAQVLRLLPASRPHEAPTKTQPSYYFKTWGGFKWRVSRRDGSVDSSPYCMTHQVQMREQGYQSAICPLCKELVHSETWLNDLHSEVQRIAIAELSGDLST